MVLALGPRGNQVVVLVGFMCAVLLFGWIWSHDLLHTTAARAGAAGAGAGKHAKAAPTAPVPLRPAESYVPKFSHAYMAAPYSPYPYTQRCEPEAPEADSEDGAADDAAASRAPPPAVAAASEQDFDAAAFSALSHAVLVAHHTERLEWLHAAALKDMPIVVYSVGGAAAATATAPTAAASAVSPKLQRLKAAAGKGHGHGHSHETGATHHSGTHATAVRRTHALSSAWGLRAHEALSYVRFIVEYWHCLPERVLFLHTHDDPHAGDAHDHTAHDHSHAHTLSTVALIDRLKWDVVNARAIRPHGHTYVSVNTAAPITVSASAAIDGDGGGGGGGEAAPTAKTPYDFAVTNTAYWKLLFAEELGAAAPSAVSFRPASEFVVHRSAIRRHPRAFYRRLHDWLLDTDLPAPYAGRVMEAFWHVIFGDSARARSTAVPRCEVLQCDT